MSILVRDVPFREWLFTISCGINVVTAENALIHDARSIDAAEVFMMLSATKNVFAEEGGARRSMILPPLNFTTASTIVKPKNQLRGCPGTGH